jgi:hypothetical protein
VVSLTVAHMELCEFDAAERQLVGLAEPCARQGYGAAEVAVCVQIGVAQAGRGHLDTAEQTGREMLTLTAARAEQRAEVEACPRCGAQLAALRVFLAGDGGILMWVVALAGDRRLAVSPLRALSGR